MISYIDQFLWVIFPYIMLTTFFVGILYRYNKDQYGWSARSSEILEKRLLKWGSNLFHYGIILAFGGHVAGIIVPKWVYPLLGINDHLYHLGAVYFGGLVGIVTLAGMALLIYRRINETRIRINTSAMDWVAGILLLIVIIEGVYVTIVYNALVGEFDYRSTINPWFRSLFIFAPDASYMETVPFSYKLHVFSGFLLFGLIPFTRIVHLFSLPIIYLKRSYIVYRSHNFFRTYHLSKIKKD